MKIGIRDFIPPIVTRIYSKLRPKPVQNDAPVRYKIGNYEIEIPPNHNLPKFQKSWKLYDRFLPVLARHISSDKIIIDVGANVGDTAIALLAECRNPLVCIEPSDVFYGFLQKNLKSVPAFAPRITLIQKLVGTGAISGTLEHTQGGSAKLKLESEKSSNEVVPLDRLIDTISDVGLIKVDTDGYDFDVLRSGAKIISASKPVLYWENIMWEEFQFRGYEELYRLLEQNAYNRIYIFDNFGNLMSQESNFETLKNINSYLASIEKSGCTRTFYYTDILACTLKDQAAVEKAIAEYRIEWINKLSV
jgi:FkbM family methyltransferase